MSALPRWLLSVRQAHGEATSEEDALLLYRPAVEWEQHNKICKAGKIADILSLIDSEDHPQEKEMYYVSSFNMLDQYHHDGHALDIGYRYLLCFTEGAPHFRDNARPDERVLKRMAILYEQAFQPDMAVWVCDLALHFGISEDGTKRGYQGRRGKLTQKLKS